MSKFQNSNSIMNFLKRVDSSIFYRVVNFKNFDERIRELQKFDNQNIGFE
jgi:hypothetical protein